MGVLHLFPKSGFDQSTTTPVLLGVLISWAFTEAYGWVFAGLVVPGYLAAVFLLDPRAAVIDVVEALLTYVLARGLGEWLPRTGFTSRTFGRERFFLVVLSSIVVRLAVEGAILPRMMPHATWAFSIGLVVVPLAANACWKTGLTRGVVQNGVPTLVVYLLLRYVFVPYTNLSLAGFELATENIAASFLASPKAYILLITGAVLAAAANVRYGWDFNGILVPALLALVVIEPTKFVATFVEVAVLLGVTSLVVRFTPLSRANIEGPRRTVLYFTIDYALRFAFAGVVGRQLPGEDVVELMGFGYLLPTLLAVKISQKGSAAQVLLPALKVSLASFVVGSLVGFAATLVDRNEASARPPVMRAVPALPQDAAAAATWLAALARPSGEARADAVPASPRDVVALIEAVLSGRDALAGRARGLEAQRLDGDAVLVRERFETAESRGGDPSVIARPAAAGGARAVGVIVRPTADGAVAAMAARMMTEQALDAVVVAGTDDARDPRAAALGKTLANGGVMVSLQAGAETAIRARNDAGARIDAIAARIEAYAGKTARGEISDDVPYAAEIIISGGAIEAWLAKEAPEDTAKVSLASSTAMALALDGARVMAEKPSLEELMVLRRVVLETMLGEPRDHSAAALRFAGRALGYRVVGPLPLADGDAAFALLPGEAPRPLAIFARARGVKGTVVELPQGADEEARDLALRLGNGLAADAVVIGLEPGGASLSGDAMRVAHAVASSPAAGRRASTVIVREAGSLADTGGVVTHGAWGGADRDALAASVRTALESIGLTASDLPLEAAVKEMAGRSVFADGALVALTADRQALRTTSLDAARSAARAFAGRGIPSLDGPVASVAMRLAAILPTNTPPAGEDVVAVGRRAALEQSIVARRQLADAVARVTMRAALARSGDGEYLVVVGRTNDAYVVGAAPTDPRVAKPETGRVDAANLSACAAAIAKGGSCRSPIAP